MSNFAPSKFASPIFALAMFASAASLSAEVIEQKDGHFITRDEAVVEADLKETWLALIAPEKWWNSAHTFTGDSENLRLTPQAGGCFCETVPEIDEPDRFTLEGSVEHLRVVNAQPETALRMVGALGPLQSEPVNGVLTIALTEVEVDDGKATRIVWEYNVAGAMRYEIGVISKAVDGVMSQQLSGLAKLLGPVEGLEDDESAEAPVEEGIEDPSDEVDAGEGASDSSDADTEEDEAPRESVEDAFRDLDSPG